MKQTYFIKWLLLLIPCSLFIPGLQAQPTIKWQECIGGTHVDVASDIYRTSDGGYFVTGSSSSSDGNIVGQAWNLNVWVARLDSSGTIIWQKALGGSAPDEGVSGQQTSDGGYIFVATVGSNDSDVTGFHGGQDIWVVRLTASGAVSWKKCLGGSATERPGAIRQTSDGGYIIAGLTGSSDGDVSSGAHDPGGDVWVVKLNATGSIIWEKVYGGLSPDEASDIRQTSDGGFILCGITSSISGDINTVNHGGGGDGLVMRLNASGVLIWAKTFGGTKVDRFNAIATTSDGYVICGTTYSSDFDATGQHGSFIASDGWVVKLDTNGNKVWHKCLGGMDDEIFNSLVSFPDGSVLLSGQSSSNDGDVSGQHIGTGPFAWVDAWLVKITKNGVLSWQHCYGGSGEDRSARVLTTDKGYIMAGYTASTDGDVSGYHAGQEPGDAWLLRLSDPSLSIALPAIAELPVRVYPTVTTGSVFVRVPTLEHPFQAALTDLQGRHILVIDLTAPVNELRLNALAHGPYLLRINGKNQSVTVRLLYQP